MDLFPYKARPHQEAILSSVRSILAEGGPDHLVLESPTGSGKTICTLVPALEKALEDGRRIIYTTRTNSQQLQVLKELRQVVKGSGTRMFGIGIQGRGNMCPMMKEHPDWRQGTPEELSTLCGELKKVSMSGAQGRGCPYFSELMASDLGPVIEWVKDRLPTIEELVRHCEERSICPYELAKKLMPDASLVVAPYIFVFHPHIRARLREWTRMDPDETILIVDEAHNLPEFIRELGSLELGQVSLQRARTEAIEFGDPPLSGDIECTAFMGLMEDILLQFEVDYMVDEDGLVPTEELLVQMMSRLAMTSPRIQGLIKELMVHGEIVKESRRRSNKLSRSYLGRVAMFLASWSSLDGASYVRLIRREREQVSLQAYCMDPTVAGEVLCSMANSVHISGTLSPLEEYRDSVGLPMDTDLRAFPSPFPKENLLVLYTDDVTTNYEALQKDADILQRIRSHITDICKAVPCNTAIFFPSFDIMRRIDGMGLSKDLSALGRKVLVEVQGDQVLLMQMVRAFKEAARDPACDGAVLFTVAGGRISEGMDFPERELELAMIVGIPYPKPTTKVKALRYYYDMKFGKGWDYIVKGPTVRKLLQTIGRLVRSETDIGAAVILDSRALQFKDKVEGLILENSPAPRLAQFFGPGTGHGPGSRH